MPQADTVFRALAHRRRRIALRALQRHGTLSLADLADLVAERERDEPLSAIDDERVKRVYMALYHRHVPLLEATGLARYEQDRDIVTGTDCMGRLLARAHAQVADVLEPATGRADG